MTPDKSVSMEQRLHWMSRMLAPNSIAVVGASERRDSFGERVKHLLEDHYYQGQLFLVNPKYKSIEGVPCYPDIESLPDVPDMVVVAIGSRSVESILGSAITLGVGGLVLFANNFIENDTSPPLLQRLKTKARAANIPICGGNGMGYYNYGHNTLVSFDFPPERSSGHIALIAHSGSVMTCLANTDPRLMFNLVVSPGQEINGTVADYILYALDQPTTRVVAIFIETIRDPEKFILALVTARRKQIPVVIVKVGSTEQSARMAASHSGAVAGDDSAFQAICDHYGAIRVTDMDELGATALAFSQSKYLGKGGLSSLLDSGGLREQMIDLSESRGVQFTQLTDDSKNELKKNLEFGLVAENPVDAMGSLTADVVNTYGNCLEILGNDPGTAIVSLEFEIRDEFCQYPELLEVAKNFAANSKKPFLMINSTTNVSNKSTAIELGDLDVPLINGITLALSAIGKMFRYRDQMVFQMPQDHELRYDLNPDKCEQWRSRLQHSNTLGEADALDLFSNFGLPTTAYCKVQNVDEACDAADQLGYPVVLKTANPEIQHKSDADGVRLSLNSPEDVAIAFTDISKRLGDNAIVAPMMEYGVELGFGMVNDEQFGPMVMVCAGGIYIELLSDQKFIPAPCSVDEALHNIESLNIHKLLKGARGKPPCRVDLAAQALSDFSKVAYEFRDVISEMDLNPVIVSPIGCVIVDGLVISKISRE